MEHVARQALRVHAHQHVFALAQVSLDQRHVGLAIEKALVGDDAELPVFGGQRRRGRAPDERLGPHPVLDQIGDRDHQQLVLPGEPRQLRHARHRAVLVHDFADDAGRIETGNPREIDRRLGLPGPHQHAAVARLEREDMAGPCQIRRPGARIDRRQDRRCPIGGGNPGARHALRFDGDDERRLELRGVLRDHLRQIELISRSSVSGTQISPRPCVAMKLIASGVMCSRGDRQVAFVFAVFVVDDDDHLAVADGLDRVVDGRERRLAPGSSGGHGRYWCRAAATSPRRARRPRHVLAEDVTFQVDGSSPWCCAGSCASRCTG